MKTLVLGLGNSILGDDSAGLRVASALKDTPDRPDVSIMTSELGGINLIELMLGYERAIVIDSIKTPNGNPGDIYRLTPDSLIGTRHTSSTHGIDFASTIELGRKMGMEVPREIIIYAIEADDVSTFQENCSRRVSQAIPLCIDMITQVID